MKLIYQTAILRQAEAIKDLISGPDVHFLYWYYTVSADDFLLCDCAYVGELLSLFPAIRQYSSVLITRAPCTSGSVSLFNHMPLSAASVFHLLLLFLFFFFILSVSPVSFFYLRLRLPLFSAPPPTLICLSSGLFAVQHSSPIWSE